MNKTKTLIILLLVFVLLIGGASLLYTRLGDTIARDQLAIQGENDTSESDSEAVDSETKKNENEPVRAPDFTVYDADGNEVKLSDFVGKPTVLNFWASWCGPCKIEMPDFNEKYLELGDTVNFLMVNLTEGRETVEAAKEFLAGTEYTFPVYFDTESDAAITYGVYSIPTTYFIDAKGNLIAQATGAINAETLQKGIDIVSE